MKNQVTKQELIEKLNKFGIGDTMNDLMPRLPKAFIKNGTHYSLDIRFLFGMFEVNYEDDTYVLPNVDEHEEMVDAVADAVINIETMIKNGEITNLIY